MHLIEHAMSTTTQPQHFNVVEISFEIDIVY